MTMLAALAAVVLPVFLLVGAGYAGARTRLFAAPQVDALVRFASNVAVPVLLFRAMVRLDIGETMRPDHLASFYMAELICFAAAWLLARFAWKRRPGEAVAVAFCAFFSNTLLIGVPILDRAYGAEALPPAFAIIAFHAPFNYLVGIVAMETMRRDGLPWGATLKRMARTIFSNALTIGIGLGLAVNLSGLTLPLPVMAAVDMMASAALPVALFGLGGVLVRYSMKAELGEALMISAFSLVVHPGLAWLLGTHVFDLPEEYLRAVVVIAAMPVGVNGYLFAAMYDRSVGTAASSVLLTTVLSILSISVWLTVIGGGAFG